MTVRPSDRLIIDTDAGIDDVVTLALAARSPELEIVAVTTTYGNATLAATTRNTRTALALAGRPEIPVYPGAERPLRRPLVTAPETHGETGVGYAPVPEAPIPSASHAPHASHALLDAVSPAGRPITLVTLGPLTNLALALEADAAFMRARVSRHIGMFGTIEAVGNTNRWADFNAWCDPEATDRVLRAGLRTEMVGLDVTRRMIFSAKEVEGFAASPDPLVSWLGFALRFYVEFHRVQERLDGCVVNDVLTIGEILDPGLLAFQPMWLSVDLGDGDHRGHTRRAPEGAPVQVAMDVDVGRMRVLLTRVLGRAVSREPPAIRYVEPQIRTGGGGPSDGTTDG
ncbi:MAG: nucleoside hydrolase [Gemmatimonadetes bacterium]|nr:nucleoside hydrolase [Gemmatimonadota bacterium]